MLRTASLRVAVMVTLWTAGCGGTSPVGPEPTPSPTPSPTASPSPTPPPVGQLAPGLQLGSAAGQLRSTSYALSVRIGGPLEAAARSPQHRLGPARGGR